MKIGRYDIDMGWALYMGCHVCERLIINSPKYYTFVQIVVRHNRIWQWVGAIGGGLLCVFVGIGGIAPGLVCLGGLVTYTGGKELAIRNLEDRIRELGCACVL